MYACTLFVLLVKLSSINSLIISKYIDCVDLIGSNPIFSDDHYISETANCPPTYSIMSCGVKAVGPFKEILGGIIDLDDNNNDNCIAMGDSTPNRGYARCCNLTDYDGESFIYGRKSDTSEKKDNAQESIECETDKGHILIGCTGDTEGGAFTNQFDGLFTGELIFNNTIQSQLPKAQNTLNRCTAQNGAGGISAGVVAEAICYDTTTINDGYNLNCISVWGQQSNTYSMVTCPTNNNHFMTSCHGYSPTANVAAYFIENDICNVTSTGETGNIMANAICCSMTKIMPGPPFTTSATTTSTTSIISTTSTTSPTATTSTTSATTMLIVTANPTIMPTNLPTMNPSQKPTGFPTISPSIRPSNGPSSDPTMYPSVSPTNTPFMSIDGNVKGITSTNSIQIGDDIESENNQSFMPLVIIMSGIILLFLCFISCIICYCVCHCAKSNKNKKETYVIGEVAHQSVASRSIMQHPVGNEKQHAVLQMSKISSLSNKSDMNSMEDEGTGTDPISNKDTNSGQLSVVTPGSDQNNIMNDEFIVEEDNDNMDVITPGTGSNDNGEDLLIHAQMADDIVITGSDEETPGTGDDMNESDQQFIVNHDENISTNAYNNDNQNGENEMIVEGNNEIRTGEK